MRRRRDWQLVDHDVTFADDLVLRPVRPWTTTTHLLLEHLRAQGLTSVPEPVGIEGDVAAVRYIPGDSGVDAWQHEHEHEGLCSAARLLREVHDASRGFVAPEDAPWPFPPQPSSDVICHGDPGPWNMVWDGPRAVGLIDWDLAHPAPAMSDVAYALEHFTPFRGDDVACDTTEGHHFPAPPDRRARLSAFASAYGLASTAGLVDRVIDRQAATITQVQDLAERQIHPQQAWVEEGYLDELRGRLRWSREHRHLFE